MEQDVDAQGTNSDAAPVPRSLWLKLLLSCGLGIAIVAALAPYLRAIPSDLRVSPLLVAVYLATLLPFHLLRAGRWVFLLRPFASETAPLPSSATITRISLAGYMWIALLPFRLGEFARPCSCRNGAPWASRRRSERWRSSEPWTGLWCAHCSSSA